MCGISLLIESAAAPQATLDTLATMHADLADRGPDGEGWLLVDADLTPHRFERRPEAADLPASPIRAAMAFRRLAIRDLREQAAQPIARRGTSLWICHNGEIYNDPEIRHDLAARGAAFSTGNDAETILAAYEAWGEACFERLRGMWATAIVDLERGRLVLCRDRLGIKPLYYATDGSRLLAASHPRTVARALANGPQIDLGRWHRFLRGLPADHAEGSFFAGVKAVPAGTLISVDLRNPAPFDANARNGLHAAPQRYWSLTGCLSNPADARDPKATADQLLALLETSTREHLIADRAVGCMLSGGLDSSVVACLAARESRAHGSLPTSFSIVYDDPRMSEWPYIQTVAAHAGIKPITHVFTPAEAWTLIDPVVAAQGEPLLGQDALAQYRGFRLARDHGYAVALEGQAADEIFAGLPAYEAVMFREWMRGGAWGRVLAEARLRAAARRQPVHTLLKEYAVVPTWRRWTGHPRRQAWVEPQTNGHAPTAALFDIPAERSTDASMLNRYLFDLVRHTNLPAVLGLQDRSAMAHGVENRPPFLDHRIVEWAFRLPSSSKVGGGRRKRVLWNVAQHIVPQTVLGRTDKRAIISRNDWMPLRSSHAAALAEMAASPRLREAPFVRADRMQDFVLQYLRGGHDDVSSVWRLYTGWRWLEQFRPTA